MSFTLAIVGRPNVGKSTLFNRLVGKRVALVDDQPGVTRDLREGDAQLGDLHFVAVDTAGLEDASDESLPGRMRKLTERAVAESDVCLFVVDARAGITPLDQVFADLLRRSGATVVLAVNKAEGRLAESAIADGWALGLGDPIGISAEHGEGMGDLYAALAPLADRIEARAGATAFDLSATDDPLAENRALQVAILGRPNAGKSTLVNAILGEERMLTGPEAGITRDSISHECAWGGRRVRLFDTAGLRRKARVVEKLEKLSTGDALRAVRFAEVAVLLLDNAHAFETQDLRLADLIEREGRAVVIAVNKWDEAEDRGPRRRELVETLERMLPQLRGVELVTLSALTGRGVDKLAEAVFRAHRVWNTRVTTARLNQWLARQVEAHPPPAVQGRRIKLRYMTQVKTRPPSFALMSTRADKLPESYSRYLVNALRRDFDLPGTPIRLFLRKGENPYADS